MSDLRTALTACALVLAMAIAGRLAWRQRLGAVMLALLSFVWLTIDRSFEGAVLIEVSSSHGLVLSDLVGLLGLVAAGYLGLRRH